MKRKIKIIAGILTAVLTGVILCSISVLADESCICTPEHHSEDCSCGCGKAAAKLKEAEDRVGAATTNVIFTERELGFSKQYAEAAQTAETKAKEEKEEASAAYDKAVADGKEDLETLLKRKKKADEEYTKAVKDLQMRLDYLKQDEENAKLAKEELEKAESALKDAQSNMEEAEYECNSKYYLSYDYRNEKINLGFKFTDNEGKAVEGVRITMISIKDNSAIAVSVSDKNGMSYANVNSLEKYKVTSIEAPKEYNLPAYDVKGNIWDGAMGISFAEYIPGRYYPELGQKGRLYPEITTVPKSDTLLASVKSSGYWENDKRIDIVLNKVKKEKNKTAASSSSVGKGTVTKEEKKIFTNNGDTSEKQVSSSKVASVVSPQTGDNGKIKIEAYTILMLTIISFVGMIIIKKRKVMQSS